MAQEIIKLKGTLCAETASAVISGFSQGNEYILDFEEVDAIHFAAIRALLNCRRAGFHLIIVNACDSVAERFEDTGVSGCISVCRKPKVLDLSGYEMFGESFLSKAYNSQDGDAMIKVYGKRVPKDVVAREKSVAKAVLAFGIPTPLVGTIYSDGENMALDFERVHNKRSYSRVISEEPERLEEISTRFARMCKRLHSTPCDTSVFSDRADFYRQAVMNAGEISQDDKLRALDFINGVKPSTTCLHGDMQMSNIITTDKEDMWIDLSDFGYGNPMFDMGMWYFLCRLNAEHITRNLFHFGNDTMARIWPVFAREYFGADTPEKLQEVERSVEPFAALHMLYLGSVYGFEPHMLPFIRRTLFG